MKSRILLFSFSMLIILCLVQGCSPDPSPVEKDINPDYYGKDKVDEQEPLNPNGDSPLALLMRRMTKWAEQAKKNIDSGNYLPPVNMEDFNTMLTAAPTDSTVKGEPFTGYAKSWLASLEALYASDKSTHKRLFNAVITQCVTCHQSYCQGPIKRIRKLAH
jgi:hypothetical protein